MAIYERLLIDGQDLNNYCTCVESLDGLYFTGTQRSENITIPGMNGEVWVEKPFQAETMELGLTLAGDTTAEHNSMLRSLTRLVKPGRPLNLERRMSYSSGNEIHVATGEYVSGLRPQLRLMRFGKVALSLRVFEGMWHDNLVRGAGQNIASGGSITVAGDLPTVSLVVLMSAGTWIQNDTNGHRLENTAPAGGTVRVDATTMVATQDGLDVSYSLKWTHRHPMRLEPGVNTFTGSAPVQIEYRAAYL